MSEHDIQKLVEQCLEGDTRSFEALIDRYQKPLFNTALQMTGDREDAKDVTQTVFIKTFNNLASYNPKFKFFSWIYRMLINEAMNHCKRAKAHQTLDPGIPDPGKNPEEIQLARDLSERVQEAVMDLPLDYRLVIVLRYFNDLSYKEIAFVVNTQEKTVKSRLYTARKLLAEILQSRGIYAYEQ
jgi:RNA polymerase sigma-70 factor (ECF subfamily)